MRITSDLDSRAAGNVDVQLLLRRIAANMAKAEALFQPKSYVQPQTGRIISDQKPNFVRQGEASPSINFGLEQGINLGLVPTSNCRSLNPDVSRGQKKFRLQ